MSITPQVLATVQNRLRNVRAALPLYECRLFPHMPDAVIQRLRLADELVELNEAGVTFKKNGMIFCVTFPD
jgi:hypothetical protein